MKVIMEAERWDPYYYLSWGTENLEMMVDEYKISIQEPFVDFGYRLGIIKRWNSLIE